MSRAFTISRLGHVGIYVGDMDRSVAWYRDVLGLTLTGRWPLGDGEIAFMRFSEDHHNIVLNTNPRPVGPEDRKGFNALQHIAMEMASRDEWLKALAELRRKGVKITRGPLVHGFEGGTGWGTLPEGSGSRSFYFEDPDGNSLELFADGMKLPEGLPFPTPDYEDLVAEMRAEREAAAKAAE
jgi:catechol 2,3-dioxygenase